MDKQFKLTQARPCAGIEYVADGKFDSVPYQRKVAVEYIRTIDNLEYACITVSICTEGNLFADVVYDLFQILRQTNASYKFVHLDQDPLDLNLSMCKEFEMALEHASKNQKGGVVLELTYDEGLKADVFILTSYDGHGYNAPRKVILPLPSKGIK